VQKTFAFESPPVSVDQASAPAGYSGLYGFHKYWGKKPHETIAFAIQHLSQPGDLVVDPFVGSGTAARESVVRGRRFIGFDVNPVAVKLAQLITSPPPLREVRSAFARVREETEELIASTYRLTDGGTATHYLWTDDRLTNVWVKGNAKTARQELAPTAHDLDLIRFYDEYQSRVISAPAFFSNGRINTSASMTLASILTGRAQNNIDLLLESIRRCDGPGRDALLLCLTAASGQMSRMVFAVTGRGKTRGETATKTEVGSWVIGFWRPSVHFEVNVWNCFENRVKKLMSALSRGDSATSTTFYGNPTDVLRATEGWSIATGDCLKQLSALPPESCTLLITDPPHSDRVPYLELSALWNAILGCQPNFDEEIVVSNAKERRRTKSQFNEAMASFLAQAARVLRPEGHLVVMFNARTPDVWSAISDVITNPGKHGLFYAGMYPSAYSALSVVQDNRKGAMKNDWSLVFRRLPYCNTPSLDHGISTIPGWTTQMPSIIAGGA
jgi:hypothetical protein